jgi:hypothetical protein
MSYLRFPNLGRTVADHAPRRAVRLTVRPCLVVAFFATLLGTTLAPADSRQASPWWPALGLQHDAPHPAVVRVMAPDPTGWSQGSGALVAVRGEHGLVVTNWHVVRDAAGPLTVVFPDGFQSAGRVLDVDQDWDLAALLIWRPRAQPIPLSTVAPQLGDVLTIAGYGAGRYRSATGRCTQYVAPSASLPMEMVELSAAARQGDSGGPILNDRGELAGVLFGSAGGTTSGSYCGRVRWFLAPLWPELDQPPSSAHTNLASDQTESAPSESTASLTHAREVPVAIVPSNAAGDRTRPLDDVGDSRKDLTVFAEQPRAWASQVELAPREPADDWRNLAGETPFEQAKSVLAGIGLLVVLLQVSRFVFPAKPQDERE